MQPAAEYLLHSQLELNNKYDHNPDHTVPHLINVLDRKHYGELFLAQRSSRT